MDITFTAPLVGAFFITNMYTTNIKNRVTNINPFNTSSISRLYDHFTKQNWKKVLPFFALLGGLFLIALLFLNIFKPKSQDTRVAVQEAKSRQTLNKNFSFPIKDDTGKTVTELKLFVDNAELRDEIIVQGQKAYPVQGKTFLVIDSRFRNDFDKPIEIKARDYFRLEINGNKADRLAADIHNDPVTLQPLSTKQVRLGYFISDSDKNILLYIGELKGKKTNIPIKFQ